MKHFIILLTCVCSLTYAGDSLNLSIPSAPGNYQTDKFRAGDLDCSMAIGSGTNIEFGVVGVLDNPNNQSINIDNNQAKNVGVYGRITIPIGAPKERLNCNTLYQLELQKKRMEVQRLQQELYNLRKLQFEK
jgi:hypothetical protein